MKKIIIPSAKSVDGELSNIGKLPAVIYPINEEIVFDYLLRQYSDYDEINVICYEEKERVYDRLKTYLNDKIKIIELLKLRDLGYTIYNAIQETDEQIIINFGDSIIYGDLDLEQEKDIFLYSEDYKSEKWTFFKEKDGKIVELIDKKNIETTNLVKEKMFIGVFQIIHPMEFKKDLEVAFNLDNGISSFYNALQMYSEKYPMKSIKTDNWFDVGHIDRYYESKLEVKSREFNHIKIDKERGILTKTSEDKDKFIGEIKWYLKLPSDLEYVRPRIFNYNLTYEHPSISMEYYAYHTIHELFLNGNLEYQQWLEIFERIKFIYNDFKRYKVSDNEIDATLEEMYLNKTMARLDKLEKNAKFSEFFKKSIKINDIEYKSLNEIKEILKKEIPKILYNIKELNIIHGDLCFTNIMIDNNLSFIKLIDPRGKFGKFDIYGDPRYELAKLIHSIDGGYDYIIKDLFDISCNKDKCNIIFSLKKRNTNYDVYELFKDVFDKEIKDNLKEIEMIEALLFLSMIPLHNESLNHQYAMLATGIQILDRVINIKIK